MSLEYIRKTYGVPAKRGAAVRYTPDTLQPSMTGRIVGSKNGLLIVRFPESKRPYLCHPTEGTEYLTPSETGDA